MIRFNDERYWLYAAVETDSNELLHTKLEPTRTNVIAYALLAELHEKHDVEDATILVDGASPLQNACIRQGLDFRYERSGKRNCVERIFREIKRRTSSFSNCFSHAAASTADEWLRPFAFA